MNAQPAAARGWYRYLLASFALLIPCYWQPRIQAGDLSSHVYNTWLAQLIENGRLDGLVIAPQHTNVLFDLILADLSHWFGLAWGQRLAVSLAVLIFMWGAFALVSAVSGSRVRAWDMLPCLAMLGYGWVFHMGFFNFYLALGLCFWAMALLWDYRPSRIAASGVLFGVAYTAHAVPVFWAVALLAYYWLARLLPSRFLGRLLALAFVLIVAARFAISRFLLTRWSVSQLSSAAGADQLWVFDSKYYFFTASLLLVWAALFYNVLRTQGGREVAASIPLHWCVLSAAGIFLVPSTILIPGFRHSLVYLAERMSLAVAVCVCGMLAAPPMPRLPKYVLAGIAVVFFGFLYRDDRSLNLFEQRMERAVAQVPPGQRVVSLILDEGLRANAVTHMVDRVCIGHCYSYANYEPCTLAFRVRTVRPNAYVTADYDSSWELQNGKYIVKESDLPMVALNISDTGEIISRPLAAGGPTGSSSWSVLRNRLPDR